MPSALRMQEMVERICGEKRMGALPEMMSSLTDSSQP